jgi:hypothetical protein
LADIVVNWSPREIVTGRPARITPYPTGTRTLTAESQTEYRRIPGVYAALQSEAESFATKPGVVRLYRVSQERE